MDTTHGDSLDTRTDTSTTDTREAPSGDALLPVPGLVIVAHPDPGRIGEEAPLSDLTSGGCAKLSRREPSFLPPLGDAIPRPLGAPFLSRRPLQLSAGPEGSIVLKRGDSPISVSVEGAAVTSDRRFSREQIERGVVLVLAGRIALLLQLIAAVPAPPGPSFGLVGHSRSMTRLRQEIRAASLLRVPVLLRGETGTGKELVARAVHDASPNSGPYLAVNLGALVPNLAASELFGASRGAYTGANRQREGFFRRARGGTLFLDEIGEAPVEVQVMLLRTLETGRVQPVGGGEERAVDVRVIAATDADLESAIRGERFRPALLHRLAGYEIHVPPLRARRDDIARLLVHFLIEETRALGGDLIGPGSPTPWLSALAMARLVSHDWPGNVRELQNVARRLAVSRYVEGGGEAVDPGPLLDQLLRPATDIPASFFPASFFPASFPVSTSASTSASRLSAGSDGIGAAADPSPGKVAPKASGVERRTGAEVSSEELIEALEDVHWQPGPAARRLGLSRQALYRLIDDHPDLRTAAELEEDELRAALERHGSAANAARALRVSLQGLKRRMTALGLD